MKPAALVFVAALLAPFSVPLARGQGQIDGSLVKLPERSDAATQIVLTPIDRKRIAGDVNRGASAQRRRCGERRGTT